MNQPTLCAACVLAAQTDAEAGALSVPRMCSHGADGGVFAIVEGDGHRVICWQLVGPGISEAQGLELARRHYEDIRSRVAVLEQAVAAKRAERGPLN